MALIGRFIISQLLRLHECLVQNYVRIFIVSAVIGFGTGTIHWITVHQPRFFVKLFENIQEFPFGVTFGILTVFLIASLLLYALHLESVEKKQMNDATERYLGQGVLSRHKLDAMHAEIEDCIERFRESARKLVNAPTHATIQELENYFSLSQAGNAVGEEILKLKRTSKPLLTEQAIKELLGK